MLEQQIINVDLGNGFADKYEQFNKLMQDVNTDLNEILQTHLLTEKEYHDAVFQHNDDVEKLYQLAIEVKFILFFVCLFNMHKLVLFLT